MITNGPEKPPYIDGKGGRIVLGQGPVGAPADDTYASAGCGMVREGPREPRTVDTGVACRQCGGRIVRIEYPELKADLPGVYGPGSSPKFTGQWLVRDIHCDGCGLLVSDEWVRERQTKA